jgi:hypothetical protein
MQSKASEIYFRGFAILPIGLVQQWVLQYWGRSNTHQHWFAIGLRFGQKFFNVAFCSYLHHQYFNWAAVPGGRISNSPTSQSPIVGRNPTAATSQTLN